MHIGQRVAVTQGIYGRNRPKSATTHEETGEVVYVSDRGWVTVDNGRYCESFRCEQIVELDEVATLADVWRGDVG